MGKNPFGDNNTTYEIRQQCARKVKTQNSTRYNQQQCEHTYKKCAQADFEPSNLKPPTEILARQNKNAEH